MPPRVSIIIPAYNAEDFISDAIESSLHQSISDIEVIVVNDGSSDNTVEIVSSIKDSRVRLVTQKNGGQSVAINNGVECAKGEYIKLLDADDWINPFHLEAQINAINGTTNHLASCRWGYFVHDHQRPNVRSEASSKSYDDPLEWLVDSLTKDEGMMGGWMWLIPKSVWGKAGGFDPRLNLNNDFHFSVKLLLASEGVRFAKDAVYSYRKGMAGALSASSGRKSMESAFLTTKLGTDLLLQRENSERIRKICADRFKFWLFKFYPEYSDLVTETEKSIEKLGGSDLELKGGKIMDFLRPFLGWKGVRSLQCVSYQYGWCRILKIKENLRIKKLN